MTDIPARQNYRPWTSEEISMLLSLKDSGATFREISIALDRSIGSIASRCNEPARMARPRRYAGKYADHQPHDYRKATGAHLRDILKAHGYNARWPSVSIGNDCLTRHVSARFSYVPPSGGASLAMPRSGRGGAS